MAILMSNILTDAGLTWAIRFIVILTSLLAPAQKTYSSPECVAVFVTQPKLNPYRKFKAVLASKPRISLNRFNGFIAFDHRYTSNYVITENAFKFSGNAWDSQQVGFGPNDTFVHQLQKFPLTKMTETGYITESEAKIFEEIGAAREPGQVNFFQVTRDATVEDLKQYPPELLNPRWDDLTQEKNPGKASVITATLWSVAGQVTDQPSAPRSSTSGPVAPASSSVERRSSGPPKRGPT